MLWCSCRRRVEGLQHAVVQLQTAYEKREQLERRLRTRLERELHTAHATECVWDLWARCVWGCRGGQCPSSEGAGSRGWEQKYLQENAMRHFNMETAATANPHSGSYSEMMGCTLWQGGTVYSRLPDAAITWSTGRDAMIKVLQQRNSRRDLSALCPARSTPSISLATGLHPRQASQTDERKERNLLPSLPLISSPPSSLSTSSSLPPSALSLRYSITPSHSSSTLPFSSTLPLSSSLPLHSSPTGSRDSSTQTDKGSETLKVLPLPSRAWLGLARTQRTDKTRTQLLLGTDKVEILI
ncbi:unnamed protein product [Coregonus sp. 'balchen']|nr:unnamed protein product [Coregonus sp. 'balchen']